MSATSANGTFRTWPGMSVLSPLSGGVKQTFRRKAATSVYDPQRTSQFALQIWTLNRCRPR